MAAQENNQNFQEIQKEVEEKSFKNEVKEMSPLSR